MKFKPHEYQKHAIGHILDVKYSALFLDMGLGKTACTLTAINTLIYEELEIEKVLVIAPKRVAETVWTDEIAKWEHTKHLRVSKVLGSPKQRREALLRDADIYVINRENTAWLVGERSVRPFDMLVIDELSSFKSPKSQRFKSLRTLRPQLKRVVGLTGTPAPNSLIDLWSQIWLLDMGERLGRFVTGFREKYFTPAGHNGNVVYEYKLRADGERQIHAKISDICISMRAKDWLDLPDRIDRVVNVRLSTETRERYEDFERRQVIAFEDETDISAVNAAALSNKLLQFANGAIYDEEKNFREVHRHKLEALDEILDAANGKPVLTYYSFRHDAARITAHMKKYKPVHLNGRGDIEKWNNREIRLLLAHPASAGHGLNLQAGGNIIVWFGLTWSLELYQQANARLHRQGQSNSVVVHHLVASATMDEDVVKALTRKADCQNALLEAVKARIGKYGR